MFSDRLEWFENTVGNSSALKSAEDNGTRIRGGKGSTVTEDEWQSR